MREVSRFARNGKQAVVAGSALPVFALLCVAALAVEPPPVAPPVADPANTAGPAKSAEAIREITEQGYRARLDLSSQVLRLAIPRPRKEWRDDKTVRQGDIVAVRDGGVTLRTRDRLVARLPKEKRLHVVEVREQWLGTATRVDGQLRRGWVASEDVTLVGHEDPLRPTLSGMGADRFVSHSFLAQKAKQFDDGLYAAVDLAAQDGAGPFPGKSHLLTSVARQLAASQQQDLGNAPQIIFGAGELGKLDMAVPAARQPAVKAAVGEFLGLEVRCKPIGFYTWNDQLRAIFQQDRMLQTELNGKAGVAALVEAIAADRQAETAYNGYLALVSKLTNPLAYGDLRGQLAALKDGSFDPPDDKIYFFPPSMSHESELVKKLFPDRPPPEDFVLIDELIERIRAGTIDLTPKADSGWYDYQTWSQEPLVLPDKMPEAKHLELNDLYREQLVELFKGVLALTRETHIKQLEIPVPPTAEPIPDVGPPPKPKVHIHISPELSAEPLATYYLRRADSYRFIGNVLKDAFGDEALGTMHRLTAAGPVPRDLRSELAEMEAIFHGAYVLVCRQLGATPQASPQVGSPAGAESDVARFLAWRDQLQSDPDVGKDVRMMVPVFVDVLRQETKVWVFLGWQPQQVDISFARPPAAVVFDPDGKKATGDRVELHFHSTSRTLAYPVTAEVYVGRILNREEFRKHCDTYKTRSAILENLE